MTGMHTTRVLMKKKTPLLYYWFYNRDEPHTRWMRKMDPQDLRINQIFKSQCKKRARELAKKKDNRGHSKEMCSSMNAKRFNNE